MKTFKRNAVIITVLLFVCVAAYLNWSYNNNSDTETAAGASPLDTSSSAVDNDAAPSASDASLFYNPSDSTAVNKEYFDSARLNRQQAADAAAATLTSVSKTDGASKEMVDAALEEISQIASNSIKEAQLEDLIKAKGFADCVVYISDDGINVTVPAPQDGLPASSVAKITDIVTSETDYKAADMKIIEVK
ncbi:stage III sporulation protein AH [Sporobacter termitidis DSM 10068]|uniref:Stage III sporulation protein AH n=1 Tax=Sporobacter termitidis DSM 10068 TaxID=1123282 RepID=A0A1M5Y8D6_9FIRM|nr:SpoIIIAH-like family protein [Sporobacter termitidis]SHI08242.1 stage III sporulation protein AH [Sporobacter termitidis DSM 10068]